jgi:hypothetical protein
MPVTRFRTFDEAAQALWVDRGDPSLVPRIRALWSRSRRLTPGPPPPRGLRRFRTIAEAAKERELWIATRVRERRGTPPEGSY